ncbi:MAG: hypothetical protein HKN10_11120 [Myxococcales bacterium]|nr:hypothetical protein [Deltaproteobacteria bacterium]NNE19016.1 hypothetical protein [Myxococcales bacterium]
MILRCCYVLIAFGSLFVLSCADDTVQTGEITVRADPEAPFETYETFSVLTADQIPNPPDLEEGEQLFNELVNELIVEAMQNEPVCLTYIPPDEVDETNQPDLFAGNGLAVNTDEGTFWECVGGWWWGYWGWYWDPCKWVVPVPVEWDIGSMLIPVGPPPAVGEDPQPVFAGLARSLVGAGPIDEDRVRDAVRVIFAQWPEPRTCGAPQ